MNSAEMVAKASDDDRRASIIHAHAQHVGLVTLSYRDRGSAVVQMMQLRQAGLIRADEELMFLDF